MTVQNPELIALVQIPLASLVQIAIKSYQNLLKNKGDIQHETCNYCDNNVTVYLFIYLFLTLYLVHLCPPVLLISLPHLGNEHMYI